MKTVYRSALKLSIIILIVLSGCAPASTPPVEQHDIHTSIPPVDTATSAPAPLPDTATNTPVVTGSYQPVSAEVCQILQEDATNSLGLTFTMEIGTPFSDFVTGETGQGCTLTANTTGATISDPNDAVSKLVNGFIGWTAQSIYGAGGPTGSAIGMTRDSALMLISVMWRPSSDANCPSDQPIGGCLLTPEQKIYTVTIQSAQK